MAFLLELGIALVVSAALALLAHKARQPLVLAYIVAGVLLGPALLNGISSTEFVDTFAKLGVAFLLFLVGITLKPSTIREMGKSALLAGVGQIALTLLFGFLLTFALGFAFLPALYLAIALSFSSTVVVVKLLADRNELNSLSGRLSVGILLVQDIVALGALIALNNAGGLLSTPFLLSLTIKIIIVGGIAYGVHRFLAKKAFAFLSSSQELLLLTAVAWCLLMMGIAFAFGFSIEIGALLAGISLSSIPYTNEIESKVKPLRDFFLIVFFILLGTQLAPASTLIVPAIILSIFVLVVKPLIVIVLIGSLRYRKRTGFLTAVSLGQVSEFSLIVAALGISLGHLPGEVLSLLAAVALITIAVSSTTIQHGQRLFSRFSSLLSPFERKTTREKLVGTIQKADTVILGCHTLGYSILQHLPKAVVIDFNPSVIRSLVKKGVSALLADALEPETLSHLKRLQPRVVISTIPGAGNYLFSHFSGTRTQLILTAATAEEASRLYSQGADFVLVPHLLGGRKASQVIQEFLSHPPSLRSHKSRHQQEIRRFIQFLHTLR